MDFGSNLQKFSLNVTQNSLNDRVLDLRFLSKLGMKHPLFMKECSGMAMSQDGEDSNLQMTPHMKDNLTRVKQTDSVASNLTNHSILKENFTMI